MKKLREKMKSQGGFTLIEMLIVVAIIAILVAISIPLVNANLNDAKDAADKANMRSAKLVAEIMCLNGKELEANKIYSAENGDFSGTASEDYGQNAGKYIVVETAGDSTKVAVLKWQS